MLTGLKQLFRLGPDFFLWLNRVGRRDQGLGSAIDLSLRRALSQTLNQAARQLLDVAFDAWATLSGRGRA